MHKLNGLERFAPGLAELSVEELKAIEVFTLLWTLFEAQALDTSATPKKLLSFRSAGSVKVI
ncbi:hypothetical protein [Pseudomonas sp. MWU13-2862]|uniref:hypothetical protein n=1 Tax=Pseudomonas sp. MWU13-2862 TaxID=2929054 RepID=UPI000CD5662C|nr:hypothetical protein [Pseudomonas sp. MWU13-2862]RBH53619.1 hypothetical protein C3F00_026695 [Pseudomonas sp. MWU13-2860]